MASRLQTLNGLGLNGEGRPRAYFFACTYLAPTQRRPLVFCVLVLLVHSIRCGRQHRLVTDLRVLKQPGRMVCGSES